LDPLATLAKLVRQALRDCLAWVYLDREGYLEEMALLEDPDKREEWVNVAFEE